MAKTTAEINALITSGISDLKLAILHIIDNGNDSVETIAAELPDLHSSRPDKSDLMDQLSASLDDISGLTIQQIKSRVDEKITVVEEYNANITDTTSCRLSLVFDILEILKLEGLTFLDEGIGKVELTNLGKTFIAPSGGQGSLKTPLKPRIDP